MRSVRLTLIVLCFSIFGAGCYGSRHEDEQRANEERREQLLDARSENLSSALAELDRGNPQAALALLEQISQVDDRYEGLDEARERALAMQHEARIARQEAELLAKASQVPESRVGELRRIYFELWSLRPDNKDYQSKYLAYGPKPTPRSRRAEPPPARQPLTQPHSPDSLDKMAAVFVGAPSRALIKTQMDRALKLYRLPTHEENYNRYGSVLVRMRQESGVREMEMLQFVIALREEAPGVDVKLTDAIALAATSLEVSN